MDRNKSLLYQFLPLIGYLFVYIILQSGNLQVAILIQSLLKISMPILGFVSMFVGFRAPVIYGKSGWIILIINLLPLIHFILLISSYMT